MIQLAKQIVCFNRRLKTSVGFIKCFYVQYDLIKYVEYLLNSNVLPIFDKIYNFLYTTNKYLAIS
jgi:hypothetical protein